MFGLAVISISGLLWFLIYAACLVGFVMALRWLAGKLGWSVSDPIWGIVGFVLLCFLLLYLLGAVGSPGPFVR
jgi:hypothetical protein